MKNSYEHIDLIERYLYDDMTKEELEEFNKKLRKDTEFNKLFYEMDNMLEGIRQSAKQSTVEEKLARLEMSLPEIQTTDGRKSDFKMVPIWDFMLKYKVAAAAAFSLLIVSVVVLTNLNNSYSPEELYAQYFETYENISGIERGKSDIEKLQYAMIAYEQANYEQAIKIFEEIELNSENQIPIWLYGGVTYLKLDRVNEAKQSFLNIIDADPSFEPVAKWYLSMCYLHEGDTENAKPLLQEIKDSGRGKYEDADEILSKLK